jgi:serine/threonine protein kinase
MRPELLAALEASVRAEVESLLAAVDRAPAFMRLPEEIAVEPGAIVGAYVLIEEIGRGGMGVVYRAKRRDGEFTRQVAVKIAGGRLFGPDAERRFIQERQILAQLDHPHIVRLLDGGVTGGRRYFVMELVNGTPITEYCKANGVARGQRLDLFRNVCSAMHYAHQRLILHRDLKPANVIVTSNGVVKVLDFGIAQIVHGDGAAPDASTMLHPFSLACASPEQLRGEPLSLSSDIYSLGVLLFELLTDVNPQYKSGETFEETYRRVVDRGLLAPSDGARRPKGPQRHRFEGRRGSTGGPIRVGMGVRRRC